MATDDSCAAAAREPSPKKLQVRHERLHPGESPADEEVSFFQVGPQQTPRKVRQQNSRHLLQDLDSPFWSLARSVLAWRLRSLEDRR